MNAFSGPDGLSKFRDWLDAPDEALFAAAQKNAKAREKRNQAENKASAKIDTDDEDRPLASLATNRNSGIGNGTGTGDAVQAALLEVKAEVRLRVDRNFTHRQSCPCEITWFRGTLLQGFAANPFHRFALSFPILDDCSAKSPWATMSLLLSRDTCLLIESTQFIGFASLMQTLLQKQAWDDVAGSRLTRNPSCELKKINDKPREHERIPTQTSELLSGQGG